MRLLTRDELAARWGTSKRTIDRKRQDGLLPWVDVSGGQGSRPIVRFRDDDVEEYERRFRQNPTSEKRKEAPLL